MRNYVRRWHERIEAQQRILDGKVSDVELLGELLGVPPNSFQLALNERENNVLAYKIHRWWLSLSPESRPKYVTMNEFVAAFGGDGVGAWKLGNALRQLGWSSSRRRWKENAPRSRIWIPPTDDK